MVRASRPSKRRPAISTRYCVCMMGAWLSKVGIVSGTRLGASHAIGHILGGSANVPHGHTSCVMLPYVLDFNAQVNSQRQREVRTNAHLKCSTTSSAVSVCPDA